MSKFEIKKPSPAMAVALVALFVALGGGSYAAVKLGGDGSATRAATAKSGERMKGIYRLGDFDSSPNQAQFDDAAVSYPKPLKSVPTLHFIAKSQTPPPECPGTALTPKAKRGHLCVYEHDTGQRDPGDVPFLTGDARDKLGFSLSLLSAAGQGSIYFSEGTWAVTAP
jgi:hypothetical protein